MSSPIEQVANVYVPFLFKYAIDYLNAAQPAMAAGQSAVLTSATALVIACAPAPLVLVLCELSARCVRCGGNGNCEH